MKCYSSFSYQKVKSTPTSKGLVRTKSLNPIILISFSFLYFLSDQTELFELELEAIEIHMVHRSRLIFLRIVPHIFGNQTKHILKQTQNLACMWKKNWDRPLSESNKWEILDDTKLKIQKFIFSTFSREPNRTLVHDWKNNWDRSYVYYQLNTRSRRKKQI